MLDNNSSDYSFLDDDEAKNTPKNTPLIKPLRNRVDSYYNNSDDDNLISDSENQNSNFYNQLILSKQHIFLLQFKSNIRFRVKKWSLSNLTIYSKKIIKSELFEIIKNGSSLNIYLYIFYA